MHTRVTEPVPFLILTWMQASNMGATIWIVQSWSATTSLKQDIRTTTP
jgi:type IV secretory pathway TrbD component